MSLGGPQTQRLQGASGLLLVQLLVLQKSRLSRFLVLASSVDGEGLLWKSSGSVAEVVVAASSDSWPWGASESMEGHQRIHQTAWVALAQPEYLVEALLLEGP